MRICHVGNADSLNVKVFVDHFSKAGHEVHTFGWGDYIHQRNDNVVHHDLSIRRRSKESMTKEAGVLDSSSGPLKEKSRNGPRQWTLDLLDYFRIRHIMRTIRPDVIHGHEVSGYGMTATSFTDIPKVVTCWGSDINKFPWESKWVHYKVATTLDRTDIIHVNNPDFARTVRERFGVPPDKIRNISWGIDTDLFDPASIDPSRLVDFRRRFRLGEKDFVVIYPAGFRDKRLQNYITLLQAFSIFHRKVPGSKLVMLSYGRSSGMPEIKKVLDEKGLWNDVRIIDDFIPQEDMPYLFSCTNVAAVLHDVDQMAATISESILMGNVPLLSRIDPYLNKFEDGRTAVFTDQKSASDIASKLLHIHDQWNSLSAEIVPLNIDDIKKTSSRSVQMGKLELMYQELMERYRK